MKVRQGFVSNSSSSSFIIDKTWITHARSGRYEDITIKSVKKYGKEYIACFLLNLKAEGQLIYEDAEDEENDEGHRASAEGIDVPIKVVLKKTDKGFYIKSVTEYDTLDIAKEESDGFK